MAHAAVAQTDDSVLVNHPEGGFTHVYPIQSGDAKCEFRTFFDDGTAKSLTDVTTEWFRIEPGVTVEYRGVALTCPNGGGKGQAKELGRQRSPSQTR